MGAPFVAAGFVASLSGEAPVRTIPAGAASSARASTSAIGNPTRTTGTTAWSIQMKQREYLRRDLGQQPAHDRMAHSDAVHVTGLQFLPQAPATHAAPHVRNIIPHVPAGPFWHMTRGASGVSIAGGWAARRWPRGVYSSRLDRGPTCAGQTLHGPANKRRAMARCDRYADPHGCRRTKSFLCDGSGRAVGSDHSASRDGRQPGGVLRRLVQVGAEKAPTRATIQISVDAP